MKIRVGRRMEGNTTQYPALSILLAMGLVLPPFYIVPKEKIDPAMKTE